MRLHEQIEKEGSAIWFDELSIRDGRALLYFWRNFTKYSWGLVYYNQRSRHKKCLLMAYRR